MGPYGGKGFWNRRVEGQVSRGGCENASNRAEGVALKTGEDQRARLSLVGDDPL